MHMQLFAQPLLGFLFLGGIIGMIVGIVTTVFWLWMLIDAIANPRLTGIEKLVWVLVVLFLHVVGAQLLYFLIARGNNRVAL